MTLMLSNECRDHGQVWDLCMEHRESQSLSLGCPAGAGSSSGMRSRAEGSWDAPARAQLGKAAPRHAELS